MESDPLTIARAKPCRPDRRLQIRLGWLFLAGLAAILGGCAGFPRPTAQPILATEGPTAEFSPSEEMAVTPTIIQASPLATLDVDTEATATVEPETPTATLLPALPDPTATATPTPEFPRAEIQILAPGPLSRVISPLRARALLEPGARGRVHVELIGEDGRLLVRQLLVYNVLPGRRINVSIDLDFEIAAVAETGRLLFSTQDFFGRVTRLASVEVILLSAGEEDINPPGDLLAPILIREPRPDMLVQGGELLVSGMARPNSVQPLVIELIDQQGRIIGSRFAEVPGPPEMGHRPFEATVLFDVSEPTRALLAVRARGDRIPGTTLLTSEEIIVSP